MARDAELDRLKTAQDRAYHNKQCAHEAANRAWQWRSEVREGLNRAHKEKQRAYVAQDALWQDYKRLRSCSGPLIDALNSQQETAFENMKRAFDQASQAHKMRDGASAREYADEGHRYKQEARDCVAERRRLVEEIRDARGYLEAAKPDFQRAKENVASIKREFDEAKAAHERALAGFKHAKAEFDQAVDAFRKRFEVVRAESRRKKDNRRSVAERAGVPRQYCDDVWVSWQAGGIANIYFGGVGKPNGPGHGHYVMDRDGNVTYRRDPFDPHGSQNFQDTPTGWTPFVYGTTENGHVLSFREGYGENEGHTLIADGEKSRREFDSEHNHYGKKREGGGRVEDDGGDRGYYTGPGH